MTTNTIPNVKETEYYKFASKFGKVIINKNTYLYDAKEDKLVLREPKQRTKHIIKSKLAK